MTERVKQPAQVLRQLCERMWMTRPEAMTVEFSQTRVAKLIDELEAEALGAVARSELDRQEGGRLTLELAEALGLAGPNEADERSTACEWGDLLHEVRGLAQEVDDLRSGVTP